MSPATWPRALAAQTVTPRRLRILNQQLVIPDFHGFTNDLTALYHFVEGDDSGANADYIPILRCALKGLTATENGVIHRPARKPAAAADRMNVSDRA